MSNSVVANLHAIQARCHELFDVTDSWVSPPVSKEEIELELLHSEWIVPSVWACAQQVDGFGVKWKAKASKLRKFSANGVIELLPLVSIYDNWDEEFGMQEGMRMQAFRPVDLGAETLIVGLFNDEIQDQGLYLFSPGEGDLPYPLGVDLTGYIKLLEHTLGYTYWQLAILSLLPDDGHNPIYSANQGFQKKFRQQMTALVPAFDYDAFTACYHEVKLKDYTPSLR